MLQLGNKITVGEPIYKFQNNHSVDFDGVDDFIQLGQGFTYTQHAVSAWIKLSSLSNTHTILSGRDSSTDLIRFWVASSDNKVRFRLGDGSNSTVTNPTALEADRWYHVVATYDGTNIKIYVDSVLGHSLAASKNVDVTANLKIGEDDDDNNMHGKIDELAIYDRALTAAEVTEIYRIKYGANLVQNGRFDELGSELVTNGDFAISGVLTLTSYNLGWLKFSSDTGSSISDGVLNLVHQPGGGFKGRITLSNGVDAAFTYSGTGEAYKLVYEVKENIANSNLFVWGGHNYISIPKTVGTHTVYYNSTTTGTLLNLILRNGTNDSTIKLDNISIKQVDPNDRFTLGTDVEYGNGFVKMNNSEALQGAEQLNVITSGVKCKVTFTVQNYVSGTVNLRHPLSQEVTANGTYVFIGEANSTKLLIRGNALTNNFEVTNLMVEQQKYVATNLKLNSGNYKSADPVIVSTKSVDLDGSDAYLEVTKKDFLGESDFTISVWIRPDTVSANNYIIGQSTDDNTRWYIRVNTLARAQMFRKSGGTTFSLEGGAVILNEWNNIVVSADRSNSTLLYLNGVHVATAQGNSHDLTTTGNLRIGSFEHFDEYFDGTIDEVGIFNTALSSEQVGELYNQGVPSNLLTSTAGIDGSLIGYWKMGDGTLDEAPLIADQTNATLGSELVVNGDFATDSDWTKGTGWTISGGKASYEGTDVISNLFQSITSFSGKTFLVEGSASNVTQGFVYVSLGGSDLQIVVNSSGSFKHYVAISSGNSNLFISARDNFIGSIDNVSVKQVNGNPALMQNTPTIVTDAPLTKIRNYYRMGDGIIDKFPFINDMIAPSLANISTTNLLPYSEDLSQWNKKQATETINYGISPIGTQTSTRLIFSGSNLEFSHNISTASPTVGSIYIKGTSGETIKFGVKAAESIFTLNGEWQRIQKTGTRTTDNKITVNTYDSATARDIEVWGAQLEEQTQASAYIKTEGSPVSRTATVENVYGTMTNMTEADITNDVPS